MIEEPTTQAGFRKGVTALFREAKSLLDSFKVSIESRTAEIETSKTKVNDFETQIEASATKVAANSKIVSDTKESVEITNAEYEALLSEAMDPERGISKKHQEIVAAHKNATEQSGEISQFRDSSLTMKGDVEKSKTESSKMQDDLTDILSESNQVKEDIFTTYRLATEAGLAGALKQRKHELYVPVIVWLCIFVAGAAATIILIFIKFDDIAKSTVEISILLSKIFFVTPSALITAFAFGQYRSERKLLEEYSFKAAMANTLESYAKLLKADFTSKEDKKEILGFILKAMHDIYDRSVLVPTRLNFSWGMKSKLAQIEATIKEEANEISDATEKIGGGIVDQIQELGDKLKASDKGVKKPNTPS